MKKIVFAFAFAIAMLASDSLLATSSYYAKGVANVSSSSPSGAGTVYTTYVNSGGTPTAPADSQYSSQSSATSPDKASTTYDFYFYAKPAAGYMFSGWSEANGGTDLGIANPLKYPITSPGSNGTTTKTLYATFIMHIDPVTVTFLAPEHGSFSATDGTTTLTTAGSITSDQQFNLTATPASGYKMGGWYTLSGDTKTYFSANASTPHIFTEDCTVGVDFVPSTTPLYKIKGRDEVYFDLNDANTAANGSGTIVLVDDGILPAGNYTISSGVTLLIPYNSAYTVVTTSTTLYKWENADHSLKTYKTLTMANGAVITVYGTISVASEMTAAYANEAVDGGCPCGYQGKIIMEGGSRINVENGAKLYVYGFITGPGVGDVTKESGTVVAKSGSEVWENFQFTDWPGGTVMSSFRNNSKKVFPIRQYYVQNIECPFTLEYGANEQVITCAAASSTAAPSDFAFAGASSGLFRVGNGGTITKRYDGVNDRIILDINGTVSIESTTVTIASYSINSANFVLPFCNNWIANIRTNSTFTINYDTELFPDSRINIDNGGSLVVSSGKNLYVYDKTEWGNFCDGRTMCPLGKGDVPSMKNARSWAKTGNANILVNGTLAVNGSMYTTTTGANIYGTEKGQIIFATAPTASATINEAIINGTSISYTTVACTAPQLRNADDSFTATTGSSADTTFYSRYGFWTDSPKSLTLSAGAPAPEDCYSITVNGFDVGLTPGTATEIAPGSTVTVTPATGVHLASVMANKDRVELNNGAYSYTAQDNTKIRISLVPSLKIILR